ncbi:MAG: leucine-rich repeat protein [Prevotella sp.]|nr:leucine-rich repeat protein [Prevotella sp.]
MKKRLFLSIMMFLPMLASADPVEIDGICYNLVEETKAAEVTANYNIYRGDITIPESVEYEGITYSVTSIGGYAFYYCTGLKSVTIPNSVITIGESAFDGCKNLSSVTIANGVTSIGVVAFRMCTSLTSLTIPNSVTAIAESAFQGCDGLQSIIVDKGNTVYDSREDCNALIKTSDNKLITGCMNTIVPNSVTAISSWAFFNCEGLISINIPNSVTTIGEGAFYGCINLLSINIPSSITEIEQRSFTHCEALTSITIPNSVTTIGEGAFYGCIGLTSITIGSKVKSIGFLAFTDCLSLLDVYCYAEKVPETQNEVFRSANIENATLHVPAASIDAYSNAEQWKDFGNIIALTAHDAYRPFLKEGKTWIMQEYYQNGWTGEQWTKDVSYVINGTTEIDGKTYYKMYRISEEGSKYLCALREENRKVWQYVDSGDDLLYDFGMSVGDSYRPSYQPFYFQLTAIKPMWFQHNQLLNVLHYDVSVQYDPTSPIYVDPALIVEGVGCEKGWNITELYAEQPTNGIHHGEDFLSCYEDGECIFTADDFNDLTNPNPADNIAYRPFVEEGKVWKVGDYSGNPVQRVEYYYFDGDTIINGKNCKQMMRQRYVNPEHPDYANISQLPSLSYVGAWYEEDKKVYEYDSTNNQFILMYDFSLDANAPLQIHGQSYVIGSKQTGGIKGFKGVYRDVMMKWDGEESIYNTTWLEGVGGIDGPTVSVYLGKENHVLFLMSCTVGDEVIYLNDEYEDGATPEEVNAKKHRFDFNHTIKTKPKTRGEAQEQPLYGEYNDLRLGINLDPLGDVYQVRITDESGNVVYEKAVNTVNIVALSIDISAYAKGRYTVIVENNNETFTGEIDKQTTGIKEVNNDATKAVRYYSIDGKRISTPQRGLNIIRTSEGKIKKIVVKW